MNARTFFFFKTLKVPETALKTLTHKHITSLFSKDALKIQQVIFFFFQLLIKLTPMRLDVKNSF